MRKGSRDGLGVRTGAFTNVRDRRSRRRRRAGLYGARNAFVCYRDVVERLFERSASIETRPFLSGGRVLVSASRPLCLSIDLEFYWRDFSARLGRRREEGRGKKEEEGDEVEGDEAEGDEAEGDIDFESR